MYNRNQDIVLYIYTGILIKNGDNEWIWWITNVWYVWTIPEGYGFYIHKIGLMRILHVWWWVMNIDLAICEEINGLKVKQNQHHITFTDHVWKFPTKPWFLRGCLILPLWLIPKSKKISQTSGVNSVGILWGKGLIQKLCILPVSNVWAAASRICTRKEWHWM